MDKIADLAQRMRAKRASGSHPYVLVLGAGASISSGTSLNRAVVERVIGAYDLKKFDAYLSRCSNDERFSTLRDLVEGTSPSKGYQGLAELIRAGYFNVILSTNFDPLLEDAVTALQMRRRDYLFLIHGVMEPDFIANQMDNPVPRVKIVKLHGDLFYHKFYYTDEEIKKFPQSISRLLEIYLNERDIMIVGHGMRDRDINRCLKNKGGSIWCINPNPPYGEIARLMKSRKSEENFISGQNGGFDQFFSRLRSLLLGGTAEAGVDKIAQSIFSVGSKGMPSIGSGFLLSDTGLLVTDSTILGGLGQGLGLGVKALVRPFAGGPEHKAELVVAPEKELDYAVFKVRGMVETSPLELAVGSPIAGEPVIACISFGESQGFQDGKITRVGLSIPIGMGEGRSQTIRDLIETDIHIEPGACGSPLVRGDGRVVGVLVAGNGRSYALTSLRLKKMLAKAGLVGKK
jgi:S1-C subfamily serine protease